MSTLSKPKIAVAGARGYSGLELVRMLLQHPNVDLRGLYASAEFDPSESWPELKPGSHKGLSITHLMETANQYDCVFLALPHEASHDAAPQLMAAGANVIDLSGAFRLQTGTSSEQVAIYEKWYKFTHKNLPHLTGAHYGLVPFQTVQPSKNAQLVANPGCYATALSLAMIPLLRSKLVDPSFIAVDAKSGTTGAGKKAEERLLFAEVNDNCLPYRVGSHQHEPEVQMALDRWGGSKVEMSFTPHLLPVRRGIIASIYGRVPVGTKSAQIKSAFAEAFGDYPFVRFGDLNEPSQERELKLSRVVGSPRTHISWKLDGTRITVFTLIDNLLKGAASQAIENMNNLYGWKVSTGLTSKEGLL